MLSVPVILLIVAAVVGAIGIVFAIVGAVRSHQQPSTDAPEQSRWGDELGFRPDAEGVHAAISQWEHGPAADGGLSEPKDPATGEFAGHPALIFAQDDGWIVAVQRDTASSVVVEIHPQPNEDADESGKATDLQVYSSDVDAMIRATDDRLVEILDNHPTDLAMAWSEGYWSAALLPLDDDGVDVEIYPDDKINEELPYVLNWLANLNDALRVLPPKEGEEESLSLQGVGPTRPLADRTDADSLPIDADSFEPEEAGLLPADPGFPSDVPVSDGSLAGLVAGGVGAAGAGAFVGSSFGDEPAEGDVVSDTAALTVVGDQPVAPIWQEDESADKSEPTDEGESVAPAAAADIDEPITEEELAAAVAADESVAIDAADDDLLAGNDLVDDGIDGDDDLLNLPDDDLSGSEFPNNERPSNELPNNVIPFTPAGGTTTGAAVTGGLAGLTIVPDLPLGENTELSGDDADEPDAGTSAGLAEDDFVTLPAADDTPAPSWAPDEEPTGELAVNHVDESALLASSWEPREHIDFADLSADDERNADANFVTEADFAEADRLMGEDLDGSDVGTDDANDIEDVEAEADALAAYAEAEAVDAVDEFPGETQVEDVPAADEWITPTTAEFDIVPEADEEAATLAAVDDDEPEEADEDVATEDFTSEDLAEEGLAEEDLIDDTEDDALLDEPLDGPDMGEDYHEISEPPHFEGQDAELDIDALGAPEHTGSFDIINDATLADAAADEAEEFAVSEAEAVEVLSPYEDDEEEYEADEDTYEGPDDANYTDEGFGEDAIEQGPFEAAAPDDELDEPAASGAAVPVEDADQADRAHHADNADQVADDAEATEGAGAAEADDVIDAPERPADFAATPLTEGFPSREVGVDVDAAGTAASAGGLGGRSAVPPVAATPEDTRPRISFVKPVASPAETGPLPIVNPTQPYYPERDEQEPAAQTTPSPAVTIPQPQESVSTGSHAVRDGEPSTMQTGQFPIIKLDGAGEPGRHARRHNEDADTAVRPSWFVPGKTSSRSRRRDEDEEQAENGLSAADADTSAEDDHAQPEVSDDDN